MLCGVDGKRKTIVIGFLASGTSEQEENFTLVNVVLCVIAYFSTKSMFN